MFKKFFNRANVLSATSKNPATIPPAQGAVVPNKDRLETFMEDWKRQWEASHEVIEGNGGDTDWSTWTEAFEAEEKSFAPTVPMPPRPK
jgi:hypothetical protein